MARPTKPDVNIPSEFATNGVKEEFVSEKLLNGYDEVDPDVLAGDNLNKFIDDCFKVNNYALAGIEDLYATALKKEVHYSPNIDVQNEDGKYEWVINHNIGHSDIISKSYDGPTNRLLWGEADVITDTQVIYHKKTPFVEGKIKVILIG